MRVSFLALRPFTLSAASVLYRWTLSSHPSSSFYDQAHRNIGSMAQGVLDVQAWLAAHPTCGSVLMTQPALAGSWRKTAEGYQHLGGALSGLQAFAPPGVPAQLEGPGAPAYRAKPEDESCGVEAVIQAAAVDQLARAEFVTFRNNLNKLFGTPFDPGASWTIDACLLGPTLFLDIVKTAQAWAQNVADQEKFTRWGYIFEALCTGQAVADANEEFGVVVSTRIGPHRLLLGAEIDCYLPPSSSSSSHTGGWDGRGDGMAPAPSSQGSGAAARGGGGSGSSNSNTSSRRQARQAAAATCVAVPGLSSLLELKTYRLPQHPRQQHTLYRHKHAKWWLQSFLAGVPMLALGGRDDQGAIHRIDLVKTADLPRISAKAGADFKPFQALQFGVHALQWMRDTAAAQAPPEQHLRFSYDGSARQLRWEVVDGGSLPQRLRACLARGELPQQEQQQQQ